MIIPFGNLRQDSLTHSEIATSILFKLLHFVTAVSTDNTHSVNFGKSLPLNVQFIQTFSRTKLNSLTVC